MGLFGNRTACTSFDGVVDIPKFESMKLIVGMDDMMSTHLSEGRAKIQKCCQP